MLKKKKQKRRPLGGWAYFNHSVFKSRKGWKKFFFFFFIIPPRIKSFLLTIVVIVVESVLVVVAEVGIFAPISLARVSAERRK